MEILNRARSSLTWASTTGPWRLLAIGITVLTLFTHDIAAEESIEYAVKSACMYYFSTSAEWPAEKAPGAGKPLLVGVLGSDPFGGQLSEVVTSKAASAGKDVRVVRYATLEEAKAAHVLFIGPSERAKLAEILPELRAASVLTVGETVDFLQHGGVIRFTISDEKVRFEINVDGAERAKLKLSSKLIQLAIRVLPGKG